MGVLPRLPAPQELCGSRDFPCFDSPYNKKKPPQGPHSEAETLGGLSFVYGVYSRFVISVPHDSHGPVAIMRPVSVSDTIPLK